MNAKLLLLFAALPILLSSCQHDIESSEDNFGNMTSGDITSSESQKDDMDYYQVRDFETAYNFCDDVSMTIDEVPTITHLPSKIIVTLENLSDNGYMYCPGPLLERKVSDTWYLFPPGSGPDIYFFLPPHSNVEIDFIIGSYHRRMDAGAYRIIWIVAKAAHEYDIFGDKELVTFEFTI